MTLASPVTSVAPVTAVVTEPACGVPTGRVHVVLLRPGSGVRGPRVRRTVDEHLRVLLPAPVPSLASLADVLLAGVDTGMPPHRQTAALAARHSGALVVAVHRGHRLWMRLGPDGLALTLRARRPAAGPPWAVWASVAHTWLVAGLPAEELGAAPMRLVWRQPAVSSVPPVSGVSRRPSRARTASAWADFERPTAE
ncbi:transcriptional regulator [Streptomyces sp. NPDC059850]|uniref:transcriptional regulator n=1 Tax=Streptomyces sp. NPDC059850 TaxID=3346970 RepID=UPI00365FC55B